MSALDTTPRLADPDALYAALMQAHRGLDDAASRRLDARLVLLLANHVGDMDVLREAIALAADQASRDSARQDQASRDSARQDHA
jgi:hypothetical protein